MEQIVGNSENNHVGHTTSGLSYVSIVGVLLINTLGIVNVASRDYKCFARSVNN